MTDTQRDCAHGALARSCDRCADAREIAELTEEVERLKNRPAPVIPRAESASLFGALVDALSSRHTYTEGEVRLVMLGMQAEIDAAQARADAAERLVADRLEQMTADRAQALRWRDDAQAQRVAADLLRADVARLQARLNDRAAPDQLT